MEEQKHCYEAEDRMPDLALDNSDDDAPGKTIPFRPDCMNACLFSVEHMAHNQNNIIRSYKGKLNNTSPKKTKSYGSGF